MNPKISKKIIIVLPFGLLIGIVLLYFFARSNSRPTTIALPLLKSTPTPAEQVAIPSLVATHEIIVIGDELDLVEKDLEVARKEDRRLIPPSFVLDLGF